MALGRCARRLFYIARCMPVAKRQGWQATTPTFKVDTVAGSKAAERMSAERELCKSRNFGSAAQQVSAEESGCNLHHDKRGRHGCLRLRGRHYPFAGLDTFDSFFPNRKLRSMIETMDRFLEEPILSRLTGSTLLHRAPWDFAETEEAFHMRLDLPGLTKEEVKVFVEDGSLVIKGESIQESSNIGDEAADQAQTHWKFGTQAATSNYSTKIELPENANAQQVKAELKNGVLSVTIPKLEEAERKKNVIDVTID